MAGVILHCASHIKEVMREPPPPLTIQRYLHQGTWLSTHQERQLQQTSRVTRSAASLEQARGVEGSCEQLCSSDVHSLPLLKHAQEAKQAHMTCSLQDATSCRISYSIPRQARYFSNTVWSLTVWSVTVWEVLRDNTGDKGGNSTDRFIQQCPTAPSHTSLRRKKPKQTDMLQPHANFTMHIPSTLCFW